MYLNDKQKQAVESAYSVEQAEMVLKYLKERESDYNPWFDQFGQWFDQTDNKGVPILWEAGNRLLECARNRTTKVNSTLRLAPEDKIRLIVSNQLDLDNLVEVMKYLYDSYEDYQKSVADLRSLMEEVVGE